MNEEQLIAAIQDDLANSTGRYNNEVAEEREKALDYYLGKPFGNEVKGRSKIVTTEVADTVESMLPQILKPFISHEDVVFFDPVGPEDEGLAKQETEYLNHVFYKENDGVGLLYAWAKDGLLSKNGIVKYWWDDSEQVKIERYTGLDEMALTRLLLDDDVEVVEQTATEHTFDTDQGTVVLPTYDVKIKRTTSDGCVRIDVVPPEEFKIRPEWTQICLKDVPFCAHEREMFVTDLIAMGYPEEELRGLGSADSTYLDEEKQARFSDIATLTPEGGTEDWTMNSVKLTECYKRVDYDGDGYAELRKILVVNDKTILSNDEIDYVPFVAWTPVPMTHRFFGRSAADQVMDLQLQKSMLLRNINDNLYQINNVRYGVVDGEVALDDLLDSTPGGAVRMTAPGMVSPLPVTPLTGHPYQMLEYFDTIKENRTGVTRYNQGIDADSLNKTASGINRIMDASAQRLQLTATLFGEGVRRLMLGVHRLLIQNQNIGKVVNLRGNWVSVNPSEWRERTNMTVVVGLGTGDNERTLQHLATILQYQKEALGSGSPLTNLDQVYNTLVKMVEMAPGLKEPSMFWTDPQGQQPQPQTSPEAEVVKAQVEVASQQNQVKANENQQDYEIELRKLQLEERKVEIAERKQALEELLAVKGAEDEAISSAVEARRAEIEAINAGAN